MSMHKETPEIHLPEGWTCWLELQDDDGTCSGKAELREGRETRCVLVLAQQPTREEVLRRLQLRADHFIRDWQVRLSRESTSPAAGLLD